jgi:ketosteroid isomerase-like protein
MNEQNVKMMPMSEQNVQIVQQMYVALGQGNLPALLGLLAEDVEWFVAGPPEEMPLAGMRHGRDQVAQIFMIMGESLELQQFHPQEFVAQDDQVVVLGHTLGRVKSTNHLVNYDWVHIYTFHDGKATKFREYFDTATVAAAFRGV